MQSTRWRNLALGGLSPLLLLTLAQAASDSYPLSPTSDYSYDPSLVLMQNGAASLYSAVGGSGSDGDLTLTAPFNLATQGSNGRSSPDGASYLLAANAAQGDLSLSLSTAPTALAPGDEILVIDRIGTTTQYSGVGTYGFYRVDSVSSTSVTLSRPLATAFAGATHKVEVLRVPNYDDVTLGSGAVITASSFDGSKGGIVAFRVAGNLTMAAGSSIDVDGLGYRGGRGGTVSGGAAEGGQSINGIDASGGGVQQNGYGGSGGGEGPSSNVGTKGGPGGLGAGAGGADGTDNADDGAGGGGGGGHAGGGGGGGGGTGCGGTGAGAGAVGGARGVVPGGGGASSCPGGDGGTGTDGGKGSGCYDATTLSGNKGTSSLGGGGGDTCGSHYGGGGGGGGATFGDAALSTLHAGGGGGGGGGSSYGVAGGAGGNGGGIALIFATQAQVAGAIKANGAAGKVTNSSYRAAAGGSGAGGTIWLTAPTLTLSGTLSAAGGAPMRGSTAESGGGGGGEGFIRVDFATLNGNAQGSAAATSALATAAGPDPSASSLVVGGYSTAKPSVCSVYPLTPTEPYVWTGFSATELEGGDSEVGYLLSADGGSTWLGFDGSDWIDILPGETYNSDLEIRQGISSFPATANGVTFCAWLVSGGHNNVILDEVTFSWESDQDEDTIGDPSDNCLEIPNLDQADLDEDGIGDACDPDQDGDGYEAGVDCQDQDAAIHPGVTEICDQIDQDCDGSVDDNPADGTLSYPDADSDGFGASSGQINTCTVPPGYALEGGDCDDNESSAAPGLSESCDGIDNNCDEAVDEGFDADQDGTADCFDTEECDGLDNNGDGLIDEGFDADADGTADCFDTEVCDGQDNDGDGLVDDGFDADQDGTADCFDVEECDGQDNDGDGQVDEGFDADGDGTADCFDSEECDGLDNNGDGLIDEGFDADGDGTADCFDPEVCDGLDNNGDGQVDEGFDSDADGTADCFDAEVCDGLDNNGDGVVDEGFDADNDGTADCFDTEVCDGLDNDGNGQVDEGFDSDQNGVADCFDSERCDGVDNNLNGQIDEGFDLDQDGYTSCGGDCDDTLPGIHPQVEELCDARDNNCDGTIDEGFDQDHDGVTTCAGDCDDARADIYPQAFEACDGVDNDCDGSTDEDGLTTFYPDRDGDDHGVASLIPEDQWVGCMPPEGYVSSHDDCDDGNAQVYPGADEKCDSLDNDCDGEVDEQPVDGQTYYGDKDGDGYAIASGGVEACEAPDGFVTQTGDCDDEDASMFPGNDVSEQDGIDHNCDGEVDGPPPTDTPAITPTEPPEVTPTETPELTPTETPVVTETPTAPPGDDDDTTPPGETGGGGCSCDARSPASAPSLSTGMLIGLALLGMRRRQRSR